MKGKRKLILKENFLLLKRKHTINKGTNLMCINMMKRCLVKNTSVGKGCQNKLLKLPSNFLAVYNEVSHDPLYCQHNNKLIINTNNNLKHKHNGFFDI